MPTLRFVALFALLLVGRLAAQIGYNIASYHGYTPAQHQAQFTLLSGQGFRPISLAVAGGLANARYSAVWIQQGGPTWVSAHGMTFSQLQAQATAWTNAGYRAKLVAACGVGSDRVFAAVFVQDGANVGYHDNVRADLLDNTVDSERSQGRRLVSCACTNIYSEDRYVAVFEPDPTGIAWGFTGPDDGTEFGRRFDEFTLGEARPTFVTMNDSQLYTTVYRDDRIGTWAMVSGRTAAQLSADKTLYDGQGLFPVCIAAGGTGTAARYSAIFGSRFTPYARSTTRTGLAVVGMGGFDTLMESHMQNRMVRSASIAVARHGRLVLARGYTNAEAGYPTTQPRSRFRIASMSKPLCGAVLHDLIADGVGNLSLDTNLVNYLGITNHRPAAANANLRRLLRHTSGMQNGIDEIDGAAWWSNLIVLPLDENVVVRYACSPQEPHPFSTLDQWAYSNVGNTALGQVVEQATGQSYMTALRTRLFQPVGSGAELFQQTARPQNFAPGEVHYHVPALYLRWQNLHFDRRLLTAQYSADYWDAAGGVVTSAIDLARALSGAFCIDDDSPSLSAAARSAAVVRGTYTVAPGTNNGTGTKNWTDGSWQWSNEGPGRYMYEHNGGTDGCSSQCLWTTDGLCIVVLTNMSGPAPSPVALLAEADAVVQWPEHDLFPSYGLPTFSRTPVLASVNTTTAWNVTDSAFEFTGEGLEQVVDVRFGAHTITSQSPGSWHDGWFEKVSPTELHVHPPQGLVPGQFAVRARSFQGLGNGITVTLTRAQFFRTRAADTVNPAQPFSVIVSQGLANSDSSFVVLGFSAQQLPTVVPGVVSLGIGNQFTSLLTSDTRQFTLSSHTARWDFPALGALPQLHLQAAVLDPLAATTFPLPVTGVETVVRQ